MNQGPELAESFVKMVGALCLVLLLIALLYLAARRFFHKGSLGTGKNPIRLLASLYLGGKKYISLVQVPGKVLVLGIAPDRISLLETIDDEKLLDRLFEEDGNRGSDFFSGHLAAVLHKARRNPNEKAESDPMDRR
jgi:flagellar biosynthetic protein FliO